MVQPAEKARKEIDQLLTAAGWHVCDPKEANISAQRGVTNQSKGRRYPFRYARP
jgi:hypothetical protein